MLQPNKDRVDYSAILMPPVDYTLNQAIATTYSLDLDTLISIPVALYFARSLDINFKNDIVQVLEAIRKASKTVKVFCQKGQICVPENQHKLYGFVEDCVKQIPYSKNHSFHPKVWVLRYKNENEDIKYRCIVLSRNLTYDRSWDIAFAFDGAMTTTNNRKTKPLVDFLIWVTEQDKANSKDYDTFLTDLAKVKFELSENAPFEDFEFFPIGINKYKGTDLLDDIYDDLLIMSPFLSENVIQTAIKHSRGKLKLFSRENELQKISAHTINQIDAYHLLSDYVEGERKFDTEAETGTEIKYQEQDIHAKIYSCKAGWNAYLIAGSANLSNRALHDNIEFMIKLQGKQSQIGTDVIFKELMNYDEDGNQKLQLFQKFDSNLSPNNEADKEREAIEDIIRKLKVDFTNASINANAEKKSENNFSVFVTLDLSKIVWDNNYIITAYLFNHENQKQIMEALSVNELNVKNSSETDLSSFLIFSIEYKPLKVLCEFAMKIEIINLPLSRNTKIFKDIIANSNNFFKYIRFLLADNYWDNEGFNGDEKNFGYKIDSFATGYFDLEQPLYEQMLKAISREPGKLKEIKEVIDKIQEEGNNEIIPENFKQLWSVFETVLLKQLKKIKP